MNFYKTNLGFQALKHRNSKLNAKQRRLLILIGTEDFNAMSPDSRGRIANVELLQQLIDLGLIQHHDAENLKDLSINHHSNHNAIGHAENLEITSKIQHLPPEKNHHSEVHNIVTVKSKKYIHVEQQTTLEEMDFGALKTFMTQYLQKHCGLMSKLLIEKIRRAANADELKSCQMQWLTNMQESRISPIQLNHALKQINCSLHQLQQLECA